MPIALDPSRSTSPPHGGEIQTPRRRLRRPVRNWPIVVAVVGLAFAPLVQTEFFSCATCGDHLRTTTFAGISVGRTEDATECGAWFRQHVEPDHAHVWCRGTYAEATSLIGVPKWPSNIAGRADGPIVMLGSGLMLAIYQCAADPKPVRNAFLNLARWDRSTPESAHRQWQMLQKLEKWGSEGCQGDLPGASGKSD